MRKMSKKNALKTVKGLSFILPLAPKFLIVVIKYRLGICKVISSHLISNREMGRKSIPQTCFITQDPRAGNRSARSQNTETSQRVFMRKILSKPFIFRFSALPSCYNTPNLVFYLQPVNHPRTTEFQKIPWTPENTQWVQGPDSPKGKHFLGGFN